MHNKRYQQYVLDAESGHYDSVWRKEKKWNRERNWKRKMNGSIVESIKSVAHPCKTDCNDTGGNLEYLSVSERDCG